MDEFADKAKTDGINDRYIAHSPVFPMPSEYGTFSKDVCKILRYEDKVKQNSIELRFVQAGADDWRCAYSYELEDEALLTQASLRTPAFRSFDEAKVNIVTEVINMLRNRGKRKTTSYRAEIEWLMSLIQMSLFSVSNEIKDPEYQ